MHRSNPLQLLAAGVLIALGLVAPAKAGFITATNSTIATLDNSSTTRSVTLGAGTIQDVDVVVHFAKCNDPGVNGAATACANTGFGFPEEIVLRLTSPGGTTVNLINANAYTDDSDFGVVTFTFDQSAASAVGGANFVGGTFRPAGDLGTFNGQNAAGTWTLFIQDTTFADPLQFLDFTVNVRTADPIPEPASLLLLGSALLGLAAGARRR